MKHQHLYTLTQVKTLSSASVFWKQEIKKDHKIIFSFCRAPGTKTKLQRVCQIASQISVNGKYEQTFIDYSLKNLSAADHIIGVKLYFLISFLRLSP